MRSRKTLGEFIIENQQAKAFSTGEFSQLIHAIRLAAKIVNHEVNKAGLVDLIGGVDQKNSSGEQQQKLDVLAHQTFLKALINREIVCGVASEEADDFVVVNSRDKIFSNKYIVLLDPLDGSSNIDVNVPVGTIFSIYKRLSSKGAPVNEADFLQKGRNQVAAGYIVYGTSTMLVYTTGDGVNGFTLNPALGTFYLSHPRMKFPNTGRLFSINDAYFEQFPKEVKDFINHCRNKQHALGYNARYIGSLVADFHRNLIQGGLYLYPQTHRHPNGKLRLLYECNPMAFLTEQAGGQATDGQNPILDLTPKQLHQTTPFFCGSTPMVRALNKFYAPRNSYK